MSDSLIARRQWAEIWREAASVLGSEPEARWMVEEAAGEPFTHAALESAAPERQAVMEELLRRRSAGEPLQYVLGRWGFRGLDLKVDRRVLIPRPETEVVVDVALAELARIASPRPVAVDLGTGSGAIALSLATELPGLEVWAGDISTDALQVAAENRSSLDPNVSARVHLCQGDWFGALPASLERSIDVIVSNPPYVSSEEMEVLPEVVAGWEPALALEAGPSGLEQVSELLAGAAGWLREGGSVVIEVAPHQAAEACSLARSAGFDPIGVRTDLAGRERVVVAGGMAG